MALPFGGPRLLLNVTGSKGPESPPAPRWVPSVFLRVLYVYRVGGKLPSLPQPHRSLPFAS